MRKLFLFLFIGILPVLSQENNRGYIVDVGQKAPVLLLDELWDEHEKKSLDKTGCFPINPSTRLLIDSTKNILYSKQMKAIKEILISKKVEEQPVIMLKFTASWCGVCMKEMPVIEKEVWEKHKNNPNFILIALAKDTKNKPQREKEIELIRERTGVTYPIITDYNSAIFELFAEKKAGVTRSVIIDQNGEISFLTRLFDHDEFNEMKRVIEKLLKKKH